MLFPFFFVIVFNGLFFCGGIKSPTCAERDYGFGSVVCVCNLTFCDKLIPVTKVPLGQAVVYETNKAGARFQKRNLKFLSMKPNATVIAINETQRFQSIFGFGGAFTDAAGINIASLPSKMQKQLLKGYFSPYGSEYSMGRVPIGSCDFSTHVYSYDDEPGDFNLHNFRLAEEDLEYKIPMIKSAMTFSTEQLLLFGSPWSSPAWMKTNLNETGKGTLKGNPGGHYYQTWAEYFVKFLVAYKKNNITFWGVTAQNEPTDGYYYAATIQALGFSSETQRDFIKFNLGPTLAAAGFGLDKLQLMIMDDQRSLLPKWAEVILGDPEVAKYVSGIAFHWYSNSVAPPKLLDITHKEFPAVFILSTEACTGLGVPKAQTVLLGSWERAESYAHDIIEDLLHWSSGWIDWNLALDTHGGPNWVNNFADAAIIVNASAKEFYRQPMFYALAQFSKLLPRGSVRIGLNVPISANNMDICAFETPQKAIVVIIVNRQNNTIPLVLYDAMAGYLNVTVSSRSIQSYIWWNSK